MLLLIILFAATTMLIFTLCIMNDEPLLMLPLLMSIVALITTIALHVQTSANEQELARQGFAVVETTTGYAGVDATLIIDQKQYVCKFTKATNHTSWVARSCGPTKVKATNPEQLNKQLNSK